MNRPIQHSSFSIKIQHLAFIIHHLKPDCLQASGSSPPNSSLDIIPIIDDRDYESELIVSDLIDKIKAKLTDKRRKILDYLLEGFTEKEIGKLLKIRQQAVSKHRQVIKQVAAQFLF